MEQWLGLRGTALEWFWSYLADRVDLKLDSQIRAVVRSSFYHLRQLAKIKQISSRQQFEIVIHAFFTTRLDYCIALYVGVSASSISHLQMV